MSRLIITSDLHLGHDNIIKFRDRFSDAETHHELMFERLASRVNKADSLFLLGDIAFNKYWLSKIKSINCKKKTLICGNHDTERGIKMRDLCDTYDEVQSMLSKRNAWFTHCPIHSGEFRGRGLNIHGHTHGRVINDDRYVNVCPEVNDYRPVSFSDIAK